jgi:REP element-mobilizing transposase RayT
MSGGWKIHDQSMPYFVTFQVVRWIDIFTRKKVRDEFIKNISFCQINKGLELYAYVIMSNHAHFIMRSNNDNLSGIIKDLKSYTSKAVIDILNAEEQNKRDWIVPLLLEAGKNNSRNKCHQFWTQDNHPVELSNNEIIMQKLNYIHQNPVRAGIVEKPEDYLLSSARNYADMEGVLDIIKLTITQSEF